MQNTSPGNGSSPDRPHWLKPENIIVCTETGKRVRDLEHASADELRHYIGVLNLKITRIESDLAASKLPGAPQRDADWPKRAGSAAKLSRVALGQLQHMLGSARDAEKAENIERSTESARTFERFFVQAAKDSLPPETFAELCADAEAAMRVQG